MGNCKSCISDIDIPDDEYDNYIKYLKNRKIQIKRLRSYSKRLEHRADGEYDFRKLNIPERCNSGLLPDSRKETFDEMLESLEKQVQARQLVGRPEVKINEKNEREKKEIEEMCMDIQHVN